MSGGKRRVMHGPNNMGSGEKAKDFKGTVKKLYVYLF